MENYHWVGWLFILIFGASLWTLCLEIIACRILVINHCSTRFQFKYWAKLITDRSVTIATVHSAFINSRRMVSLSICPDWQVLERTSSTQQHYVTSNKTAAPNNMDKGQGFNWQSSTSPYCWARPLNLVSSSPNRTEAKLHSNDIITHHLDFPHILTR